MQMMFEYNWDVREDWFKWCGEISEAELLEKRTGGVGGILHTLFHIIDVEWSWIRSLQGKSDFNESFEQYRSIRQVRELEASFRPEVEAFVLNWNDGLENREFRDVTPDGREELDTWGEVMRHMIAHEIHHIGQLSVWAREIDRKPVSANLIGRGLASGIR
ncbi:DinB family protein [Paenibacillus sp. KQZ6P-2]|uniref:DinB family protein n=1 Tax=Paenibacillus mangrovi TaxID=2931978 RepID=A0A9X1WRQ1_9BACL|nr:DinB family protein [Paenibacillus mangrovi]MCJ8014052.1 DinB family protein [Paenibacillus mangrovi]